MTGARIPLLLLPGLLCDGELFAAQTSGLAGVADVRVADLTARDTMSALASAALAHAPWPRFALGGLSMGATSPTRSSARRPAACSGSR